MRSVTATHPSRHFHCAAPVYLAAQVGANVGPMAVTSSEMSVCSGMRSLLNGHPVGRMSISDAASSRPCTCMPLGTIAATASRLFIAPTAPAEQPPNSRRCPGVLPMPCTVTSCVMAADTMRAPRTAARRGASVLQQRRHKKACVHAQAKFQVAEDAPMSPDHRSLEQYFKYTLR